MKKRKLLIALTVFVFIPLFSCSKGEDKPSVKIFYEVNLASNSLNLIGKGTVQAWNSYTAQLEVKNTEIYSLPSSINIVISGKTLDSTKYTYDSDNGMININKEDVIGNIHIAAEAIYAPNKHIVTTTASSFGMSLTNNDKAVEHIVYDESNITSSGLALKLKPITECKIETAHINKIKIFTQKRSDNSREEITGEKKINEDNSVDIVISQEDCKKTDCDILIEAPITYSNVSCFEYTRENEPITPETSYKVTFTIEQKQSNDKEEEVSVDWGDGSAKEIIGNDVDTTVLSHTFNANVKKSLIVIRGNVVSMHDFSERDITGNANNITAMIIGKTISDITNNNFYYFRYLKSVVMINDIIKTIGSQAFYYSTHLEYVNIPSSVEIIGENAFASCFSLAEVSFPEEARIREIQKKAFYECNGAYTTTGLTQITFPKIIGNDTLDIREEAFMHCAKLANIHFVDLSIKIAIGNNAFAHCSSLSKLSVMPNVTMLGDYAFYDCENLEEFTIMDSSNLTIIGAGAFANDKKLKNFFVPAKVKSLSNAEDGYYELGVFQNCTSLENVTITNNSQLESICACTFMGCSNLTKVTIGSSFLNTIGEYAFSDCPCLKDVDMSNVDNFISHQKEAFPPSEQLDNIFVKESLVEIYRKNIKWKGYQSKFRSK